jgi:hypothetical protein
MKAKSQYQKCTRKYYDAEKFSYLREGNISAGRNEFMTN